MWSVHAAGKRCKMRCARCPELALGCGMLVGHRGRLVGQWRCHPGTAYSPVRIGCIGLFGVTPRGYRDVTRHISLS